jgi:hypothetical protein
MISEEEVNDFKKTLERAVKNCGLKWEFEAHCNDSEVKE